MTLNTKLTGGRPGPVLNITTADDLITIVDEMYRSKGITIVRADLASLRAKFKTTAPTTPTPVPTPQ